MDGCGYPSSRWPAPGRVSYSTWPGPQWPLSNVMTPLAALPTAPGHARAYVRAALLAWDMSTLAAVAELVTTELATNAVRASERPDRRLSRQNDRTPLLGICLLANGARLRIEVWDQAVGFPVLREAAADSECGRGLTLVDAMTEGHWGWCPIVLPWAAKCVWAEIGRPAPLPAQAPTEQPPGHRGR
jgi:anti-sigma regulatory factor (Ser/Thr protein kinase)